MVENHKKGLKLKPILVLGDSSENIDTCFLKEIGFFKQFTL